jgi:hypothetical protein
MIGNHPVGMDLSTGTSFDEGNKSASTETASQSGKLKPQETILTQHRRWTGCGDEVSQQRQQIENGANDLQEFRDISGKSQTPPYYCLRAYEPTTPTCRPRTFVCEVGKVPRYRQMVSSEADITG